MRQLKSKKETGCQVVPVVNLEEKKTHPFTIPESTTSLIRFVNESWLGDRFFVVYFLNGHLNFRCNHKNNSHLLVLAKDCGPLDVPSNGSMSGDRTTYPHELSFLCDEGFILRGSKVRSCTSEGTWSGTSASCEGTKHIARWPQCKNQSLFIGLFS